ncbi:MAG: thioredoxin domain-containing protein [bacterium]|nr:thioredoxin domain-containing protein [bacterium]
MTNGQNRLGKEKSPYLLQHRDNPVHWYPWGEEAFRAAKEQDKPIFLSIGYSTCHWCHVMAHQSFENQQVADFLNEHFISIKLDREERPDVDDIYMSAVHAMGQRGGWPLSMFLTPQLKPFYGGTYWPREQFLYLLQQLNNLWTAERSKALETGEGLIQHLKEQKSEPLAQGEVHKEIFKKYFSEIRGTYDNVWGGFSPAPKFPHSMHLAMLLRIYRRSGDEEALQMAIHTLERMAQGGLYDHLGGGFARYSVDEQWMIPHFEKMLYDNALLVEVYLEAFQVTGIESLADVARETLEYTLRVMTHPEGGFYSAEDADSEGEEGKFYVWTPEELKKALTPEEFTALSKVYQIDPHGNFEKGTLHLNLKREVGWEGKSDPSVQSAQKKLFQIRENRVHPHKDDKILTSWNGLMIRAMAKAYQVTGDTRFLTAAHRAANFIKNKLWKEHKLLARYRDGEAKFRARVEDYAYLIQGLIDLYQCDFDPKVYAWALDLQKVQDEKFLDKTKGGYFYTDGEDPHLLLRSKEGMDGALPNANGVSALNLLRLRDLEGDEELGNQAEGVFRAFSNLFSEYPYAFSQMAVAFDYDCDENFQLAILSKDPASQGGESLRKIQSGFYPSLVVAKGAPGQEVPGLLAGRDLLEEGETLYLCRGHVCLAPTRDWEGVLQQIQEKIPLDLN